MDPVIVMWLPKRLHCLSFSAVGLFLEDGWIFRNDAIRVDVWMTVVIMTFDMRIVGCVADGWVALTLFDVSC